MRIKDEFHIQDDQIIHAKTFDIEPTLNSVKELSEEKRTDGNWHVGRIPMELLGMWIREAGLTWDDTEAVSDMVRKKLLSGDYALLRPHQGSF